MIRLNLPNAPHAYNTRVTLGGVIYTAKLRWNWRNGDWRMSLFDAEGTAIAVNRRISSGSAFITLPDGVGALVALGGDPYTPQALGETLQVLYMSVGDLAERADAADGDPEFALT